MKPDLDHSDGRMPSFFRYLLFLVAIACTYLILPLSPHFEYEYEAGQPWPHEDLTSPVTFPIEKSDEEIEEERREIINNFHPFYVKSPDVPSAARNNFSNEIEEQYQGEELELILDEGISLINEIYQDDVIELAQAHAGKSEEDQIRFVVDKVTTTRTVNNFIRIDEARERAVALSRNTDILDRGFIRTILQEIIQPNVTYDEELSERRLQEKLDNIAETRGVIEAGETIIRQGEIITAEKDLILHSLQSEYKEALSAGEHRYFISGGYLILICFLFLLYYLYLYQFHYEYLNSYRALILLMFNILIFLFISAYIFSDPAFSIYLIPFCIVPIILIAFFGSRLAFITHLMIIMLVALIIDNKHEFLLVQFVAGFAATLSMIRVRYLSQFFGAVLLTFASYSICYLGINLVQTGHFTSLNYMTFLWFGGNFILTLLAYPLIYAYEKLFGFVSDITLLELGDVNNTILRDLSKNAPGTFQHSLQVANLSESILNKINGNALLARVASLYHDIGKMHKPQFFIENQQYMNNPHDEMSAEESCREIINHVRYGEELARKHKLPASIINFIKTHHGTSRLEFFYRNEISKHSEETVDESKFRYPGPKPRSKEEAVVMITDSAEAASRSLKNPDASTIDELVNRIINSKMEDKQLENAEITLSEIKLVKTELQHLLKSLYHVRIEYPDEAKTNDAKEEAS